MSKHAIQLGLAVIVLTVLSTLCLAQVAPAEPPATRPASNFALTIYSTADPATFDPQNLTQLRQMYGWQYKLPGYGVVREVRPIHLVEGDNTLRFTDVASGIDPTTVSFQSLTAPQGATVLEQNYEYDLVNADKLLRKYLGEPITITRRIGAAAQPGETQSLTGTLLSYDGSNLVLQDAAAGSPLRVISRGDVTDISLPQSETGLITKPTLVWKLLAEKTGDHKAQVTYQTDGLTWRADYTVVTNQNDTAADIGAWVSIINESGISYPDAKLKLVAGDVQRVKPPAPQYAQAFGGMMQLNAAAPAGFAEKAFFEYHLYTLGRPTSLANNSTKQIELFPTRTNVPVTKTFVYYGLPAQVRYSIFPEPNADRNLGTESNKKVDIYLLLQNSEKNGLGIPLPAGRLRVYKQDQADGANEFIGEDVIQHTPKDEQVMVKLGSAFDIVGERKQTDFAADYNAHWITESFEITLRNHKKEAVNVIIKENLFRWTNWQITAASDKWDKQDYRTIHIPVQVAPDGEKKVTYSVKYTW
jgi:hypothetical protein